MFEQRTQPCNKVPSHSISVFDSTWCLRTTADRSRVRLRRISIGNLLSGHRL